MTWTLVMILVLGSTGDAWNVRRNVMEFQTLLECQDAVSTFKFKTSDRGFVLCQRNKGK